MDRPLSIVVGMLREVGSDRGVHKRGSKVTGDGLEDCTS